MSNLIANMSSEKETFDIENDQYIETPFEIIGSYFKGQHLERLVRHQLESYNNFVGYQIIKTIEMFNPIHIASEQDFDPVSKKYSLEIFITFENFHIYRPQIHENNGAIKLMFPQEARLRNFTYASAMTVDINIKYIIRTGKDLENMQCLYKTLPKIHIGKLPIMLKSNICVLNQYKHFDNNQTGECKYDAGGYFIINGSEKTVLGQERAAENRVYCFNVSKNNTKYTWTAEIKSIPDFKCISPKQINMMISSKNNGFGCPICVQLPRVKQPVPLFILFRALGVLSDKEICDIILLGSMEQKNKELLEALQASIIDSNKHLTQEECIKYITTNVMYTPINMDKETGARKKMEFAMEILNNDLFPHCHNKCQKTYFLGYMTHRLLLASFEIIKGDDRDSYINKRIDLTGALLNNLFRNYFNKLVKDMEKQIIREINTGSWKSTDDYENIINLTNIYKIIKSTTIENGLKRALSTGDFGIKHTNSNKVGVAQVLNRLTYVSSLSHARRISTPTDKSGKLIPPRKLHNTSWGFLCLTGDADVLMSNRMDTKKIKDVKDGNCVNTVNRDSLLDEPSDIHNFFSKMPDKLFEITTISGRKIKATADHPFLTRTSEGKYVMKKVGELETNDKVIIRHTVLPIVEKTETIVQINEEDVLAHYRVELLELLFLNTPISLNKLKIIARLIGALNTDGHVGTNKVDTTENAAPVYYSASFNVGEEQDVYQIADDINALGFGNVSIRRRITKFYDKKNGRTTVCSTWEVSKSGPFAYFMYLLGAFIGNKTNMSRKLPQWLINADLSIKREFLSAFQGGDGSRLSYQKNDKTFKPNLGITFQTTHNEYLQDTIEYMTQIRDMFQELNIICNVQTTKVNDEKTKVCIVFEKSTENLANYAETIYYAYCEEKRRTSAPIIEHLKIRAYNKKQRDNCYQYIIDNFKTESIEELIKKTHLPEKQIKKVISNFKKGVKQSARMTTDIIYDQFIRDNISDNSCISVPILSIKEIEPELVYDFTTRSENHSFVASSFVVSNCPAETPEGQSVGIVKNLSYMTHITIHSNPTALYEYVSPNIIQIETESLTASDLYGKTKVFINGAWIGIVDSPYDLYLMLKEKKNKGIINIYTSIIFDYRMNEIRVCNDSGRLSRPLLRVKDKNILITPTIIQQLNTTDLNWEHLLTSSKLDESVLEYIDPEEQSWSMIATKPKDIIEKSNKIYKYTHCEIHPSTIFGVLASCIPFPEHNQSPRNTYQCAQSKQAMGVYVTNYENRMDKTAYILNYPTRPLIDTRIMNMIHLNKIPSGTNVIVAIMTHTGYNQEDSLLINKGSIDRGLALVTVYHTEKDEDKQKINGDEEIRCKPDPTKTKGMKFGNYNKVNSKGVIPENTLVENRDIIISKIVPIKENRNDHTKVIKYEDQSKIYKTTEETYIDKNYIDRNGEGYNFAKVRIRTTRKPVIGDKFCMTSDHDVLTLNRGWVPINEVVITDLIGQLNRTTNKLEYVNPLEILEFEHTGKMYDVVTQGISQCVTLNHRMWIKKRDKKIYELIPAEQMIGKRVQFQSGSSPINNSELEIKIDNIIYTGTQCDALLILFGLFIAEGWTYINEKDYICRIEFAANKPRVQEQLKKSCELLNLKYSMNDKTFKWYINNKGLTNEFKKYSVGAVNKYLPEWHTMLSERQAKILLNGLCLGDGHETTTSLHYFTSSIKLRDDVQILAQHAGYTAYYVARSDPGDYAVMTDGRKITTTCTAWDIGIRRKRLFPTLNHGHNKEQNGQTENIFDYEGKVYCLRVPSEVFLVRRHGRCSFTGNSSRHGQKGTVGNIIPECDMPFTSSGVKPDIIINPHAIPSRMTIGQLKETLLGKILLELGLFGDGTSFGNFEVQDIAKELLKVGYQAHGEELLYNGLTGEQHECSVFMGPVFYQRLKHMVNDKSHSRSIGPMVNLTRQPAEGRSRDGGLRFGEMERDCSWYHSPIPLNCGLSVEIGTMENENYNVLGFDKKSNQLISSMQKNFLYKGKRDCVDVTFQDGRKIKFTPNHKFLTSDNQWTEISKFVLNETKIKTGITYPLIKVQEEINVFASWKLCVGNLSLKVNDTNTYFKALSFARIIGYLCADGGIYYIKDRDCYKGIINLGHMIDVNNLVDDLNVFTVIKQEKFKSDNYYSVRIPNDLLYNIMKVKGITIGSKIKQPSKLPEFILDPNCPLPIVREFLGGLFGGDGHTCVLGLHRGKRDILSSISFSQTKNKLHLDSLKQMMNDIKTLLARFDIHKVTIQQFKETSYSKNKQLIDDNNKNYQLTLHLDIDELIPFHDKIGFRYCCHKTQRLEAAVSYKRLRNEVTRQHNWLVAKVDELTNFSKIKQENPSKIVPTKKAIEQAVEELKKTEPLIHDYAIPSTHDITDHLIKGTQFGKFTSKNFPTAEEYLKEIGALDWFLNDDVNRKIVEDIDYEEQELETMVDVDDFCYGVTRECEGLPTMDLKVIDIRPAGVHDVYDIEVENTHSFLANGIVAHNCMISHGASRFTRERMYDVSDKYSVHVCKKCGIIASYNDKIHIHHCKTCDNRTDFAYLEIPYACKLLFQELNTMNVAPRFMLN